MLQWLASLPPLAVYATIAALAFLEAIIPIVPSDVVAALGAFLSHRGLTRPLTVFIVVVIANVAGTALVYALARHAGRRFFGTPTGQRLLAPGAIATIEREYLRFGIGGLVVARFIPGVRAVVPPFAGIFGISFGRTMLAVVVAALLWYAGIIGLAAFLATEWDDVRAILDQVGRTTAILAVVVALVIGGLVWRRRQKQREPVLAAVEEALGPDTEEHPIDPERAARLIIEIAYADEGLDAGQRAHVEEHLRRRWGLEARPATAGNGSEDGMIARFAERLTGRFSVGRRLALVERMWQAAFAEGTLDRGQEDWLLRRAGELLGLEPAEVARVRSQSMSGDA